MTNPMPTFLIADDSQEKTQFFLSLLKHVRWRGKILTTNTVEGAKALIDRYEIFAAFIDYYIPTTNGPSIIRYLKAAHPSARIALVSSVDRASNAAEAREAGAEAVVCTSAEPDRVREELLALLEAWRNK